MQRRGTTVFGLHELTQVKNQSQIASPRTAEGITAETGPNRKFFDGANLAMTLQTRKSNHTSL